MPQTRKNKKKHNKTIKRVFDKQDFNSGDGMVTKI